MEETQPVPELTAEGVLAICAETERAPWATPDAKVAAKVVLLLKERNMLEGVEPETQMAIAEGVQKIVEQQFGGVLAAVRRIEGATTFAAQQREIVYLTSRLMPKEG